ncbi:MAG: histidine kinase [bacterium]
MKTRQKKLLKYIDWGIYLLYIPTILLLIPTGMLVERDPYFFLVMLVYVFILHYFNRKFNFITFILKGDYLKSALTLVGIVAITYATSFIKVDDIRELAPHISVDEIEEVRNRILYTLCFIDLGFTTIFVLLTELFSQIINRQEIEAEKRKAELAIYKSQINPHFIFNTLNTIYALNMTGSQSTSDVIMKFSNIVKYMYQNTDKEMIMIVNEVKYIKELIDLHKMRLNEETVVNFTSKIDDESQVVPSMIFFTFIENVFKYGVSSSENCTIDIAIELREGVLTFTTSNTIFRRGDGESGIGIENCRKRLSLLYPDRYIMEYGEVENTFNSLIKIEL